MGKMGNPEWTLNEEICYRGSKADPRLDKHYNLQQDKYISNTKIHDFK